jgi:aryl-alcohol dehydrogenase-like predicted oxidoreductase
MKIQRRRFISSTLAGAIGTKKVLGAREAEAKTVRPTDPNDWVALGKTLKSPRLGFGTGMRAWQRKSTQTELGYDHFDMLFRAAYEKGIRLFDTADIYGSHQCFGRTLKEKPRDSYLISSKIWVNSGGIPDSDRGTAIETVERFLKEIDTDYIDLVQLHCLHKDDWTARYAQQMDDLSKLKKKGLIRAHGCTCHSLGALKLAAKTDWVDVIHTRLNPFKIKMDRPAEDSIPVLREAHKNGKGIIAMKLIGEGQLGDKPDERQKSIDFACRLDCVDSMIVGFEQTAEMDELLKAVYSRKTLV